MNPDEPADPSPFASFAMPKRSAVEEFQERQRRAAAALRTMIGSVLAVLVGSIGGSTACAAYEADMNAALTALVGSLIGGAGGSILGAILGAMCFAALSTTFGRSKALGNEFARRDPMAAVRGLMFAWSLVGAALGAAQGALQGAHWAGAVRQPLGRWIVVGSVLGGAFGLVVWFLARRRLRTPS
ncbi:MAG: hypothetical protein U0791_16765 [Gemmataceae bacterium]